MVPGRELLSVPILNCCYQAQDLAVETEPVGVVPYDLAIGAVSGGV